MSRTGLRMIYFVVKPGGDTAYHEASRAALKAYADAIRGENPELATDLWHWAAEEELKSRFRNE